MSNISTFAVCDLKPEPASRGALPLGHSPQGPGRGEQEEAERPREVGGLVQGCAAVRALPPQAQSTRAPLATPPPPSEGGPSVCTRERLFPKAEPRCLLADGSHQPWSCSCKLGDMDRSYLFRAGQGTWGSLQSGLGTGRPPPAGPEPQGASALPSAPTWGDH